jgi:hypothetical protein
MDIPKEDLFPPKQTPIDSATRGVAVPIQRQTAPPHSADTPKEDRVRAGQQPRPNEVREFFNTIPQHPDSVDTFQSTHRENQQREEDRDATSAIQHSPESPSWDLHKIQLEDMDERNGEEERNVIQSLLTSYVARMAFNLAKTTVESGLAKRGMLEFQLLSTR